MTDVKQKDMMLSAIKPITPPNQITKIMDLIVQFENLRAQKSSHTFPTDSQQLLTTRVFIFLTRSNTDESGVL